MLISKLSSRRLIFPLVFLAVGFLSSSGLAQTATEKKIDEEIKFAEGLIKVLRLPDYATKVIDKLVAQYPEAKARASAVRVESFTCRGKWDEAKKMIDAMPAGSTEGMAMKLALADWYYAFQKVTEAKKIYDEFFSQYTNGPPKEINELYGRAADKYSQMLLLKDDKKGALQACRFFLMSNPEREMVRQCKTQMAELCLQLGSAVQGDERKKYFDEAQKYCEEILWGGQDTAFGKCVVIMAHLKVEQGKKDEARKLIIDFLPMLKGIDDAMREEKISLKFSPMGECRYILAGILEEDGRALFEGGKAKEGADKLKEALTHYYTIYIKYPDNAWAGDCGKKADVVVAFLKSKGVEVKVPKDAGQGLFETQLKNARAEFRDGNYKVAKDAFLDLLRRYPVEVGTLQTVGELAQCCIRENDELYAKAMIGYISGHFSQVASVKGLAGDTMLFISGIYETEGMTNRANDVISDYFARFPTHDKVPVMLYKKGEDRYRKDNFVEALDYYRRIVETYTNSVIHSDALSRMAACQVGLGDYSNAMKTLTVYVDKLQPSAERAAGLMRLADALRMAGQTVPALNRYIELCKVLTQETQRYSPTPDDATRNAKIHERALFWKSWSYSKLTEPKDKIPEYQASAIKGMTELLEKYSKSELAPKALSQLGMLYFLQQKPEDADKVYNRLAKDYPDSEEAKNVLFTQGKCLLDIGKKDKAIEVFSKMFNNAKAFSPNQFLQVGRTMLEAQIYDTAAQAFTAARESKERGVWEPASVGLGQALAGQQKFKESVDALEDVLKKYPQTGYQMEINMAISLGYAELGQTQTDPEAKTLMFQKAMDAQAKLRQRTRDPEILAKSDIELAKIQIRMNDKGAAIATYQRMLMFGDIKNLKLRSFMDQAFVGCVPLLIEAEKFQDVMDTAEAYLKSYPGGGMVGKAREYRNQMKLKGIKATEGMDLDSTTMDKDQLMEKDATEAGAAAGDKAGAEKPAEKPTGKPAEVSVPAVAAPGEKPASTESGEKPAAPADPAPVKAVAPVVAPAKPAVPVVVPPAKPGVIPAAKPAATTTKPVTPAIPAVVPPAKPGVIPAVKPAATTAKPVTPAAPVAEKPAPAAADNAAAP